MSVERLEVGDLVETTRDAGGKDWRPGSRDECRWGAIGHVLVVHDSHGLCYDVRHEDGTVAPYEHGELARSPS